MIRETLKKQLETARATRANNGHCKAIDRKDCQYCPFDIEPCLGKSLEDWDAVIAELEGKIANLESIRSAGSTSSLDWKPRLYIGPDGKPEYIKPPFPSVDDFALALIHGGHTMVMLPGLDEGDREYPKRLYDLAAALKAESDRRREP